MGKRNNKNGTRKKAGNATTKNNSKLARTQNTPRKNMSKDIEAKPGSSNMDKYIPSGPAEEANADCEKCALKLARIKASKINPASLSRSLTQNDVGILSGFSLKTQNEEMTTAGVVLTQMQAEKKMDWQNSLAEMVQARMLSQKTGPSVSLPYYRALIRKWQTSCRAVLRRTELINPSNEHNEWFTHCYGVSIETFAKYKISAKMQKLLNMRYEMQKFKTVQLFDTAFERCFQNIISDLAKYWQSPTSSQGNIDEEENFDLNLDSMFSSMRSEYNEAAECEKRRRKSDWKLGHNGQNMGDSNIDRSIY
ncbi:hypothetical protein BOTNAR_0155g00160 [Botryotinia narcissicola]|uniref:Uncharacterized protein n=1 Tax=Botryotinia narcissicola TaxID=278944 RepID=A0A4Z1IH45_9HELO|nr:hypothetical protein BOTNAR_0155g00160 [Botryotinia narcissicola]